MAREKKKHNSDTFLSQTMNLIISDIPPLCVITPLLNAVLHCATENEVILSL